MEVKVVGLDPALSNLGIAIARINIITMDVSIDELRLVQTDGQSGKQVRKNSDDLRRARMLYEGMVAACEGVSFAIAEIPTGTQSARGAMSNGIALGVLAGCPVPIVQVQPTEVKMATVGAKTASKAEMIEWAMGKHPSANWIMRKLKGAMVPINDNEHLADACAAIEAGIRTDQFKQATAMLKAMRA